MSGSRKEDVILLSRDWTQSVSLHSSQKLMSRLAHKKIVSVQVLQE